MSRSSPKRCLPLDGDPHLAPRSSTLGRTVGTSARAHLSSPLETRVFERFTNQRRRVLPLRSRRLAASIAFTASGLVIGGTFAPWFAYHWLGHGTSYGVRFFRSVDAYELNRVTPTGWWNLAPYLLLIGALAIGTAGLLMLLAPRQKWPPILVLFGSAVVLGCSLAFSPGRILDARGIALILSQLHEPATFGSLAGAGGGGRVIVSLGACLALGSFIASEWSLAVRHWHLRSVGKGLAASTSGSAIAHEADVALEGPAS